MQVALTGSEHAFSNAGHIMSQKQTSLSSETFQKLGFLQQQGEPATFVAKHAARWDSVNGPVALYL